MHTTPLPSIKSPPQHPYPHPSVPYQLHQHHIVHHPTLPPQSQPQPQSQLPPPPPPQSAHPPASTPVQCASLPPRLAPPAVAPSIPTASCQLQQPPLATPPPPLATKPPAAPISAPSKSKPAGDNQTPSKATSPTALSTTPARKPRKPYTMTKTRELWSPEEHARFVHALKLYDRDWKKIETYIGSKTVLQIRSHAQKHFGKVTKYKTGEYIPPPRPKKRAAMPYPRTRNPNASKHAPPSSGTASESGNGSENGTANGTISNANISDRCPPVPNGSLRHPQLVTPQQVALAPAPPTANSKRWVPNGNIAVENADHPSDTSSLYRTIPAVKSRDERGVAHIHNLVDPPRSNPCEPGLGLHTREDFRASDERHPPVEPAPSSHEPANRFAACGDELRLHNGVVNTTRQQSDASNPNSSLHVLSNCVDMMTRDALPKRQPAAGWASAAAARRAHRAKVVRACKSSSPLSPMRKKEDFAKFETPGGTRGSVAASCMHPHTQTLTSADAGRKNGVLTSELSNTANNLVQKRERSPPIPQMSEEGERVNRPDPQRSSANSSDGNNDTNGDFNESNRPSASDTGNGLSSGGSGTGISPDNSDSGDAEVDPQCSNDGSGDDGNRIRLLNGDFPLTEQISSNSSGNSLKGGSSRSPSLVNPSTAIGQSERASHAARIDVQNQGHQNSTTGMSRTKAEMYESKQCIGTKTEVVQNGKKVNSSHQRHTVSATFRKSVYINGEEKERAGTSVAKQRNGYHANKMILHVNHDLSQHKSVVRYVGAPDVGAKRLRSPSTTEVAGRNEIQNAEGRERKAQRIRQVGESQSLKAKFIGNKDIIRPTLSDARRR
eukprot:gb/GEZJ01003295.1/.p1 GENE.gb/GEZJ01003295.1/~~gb/GEZJ01003295.1/.p1  ORF type:complete len:861 (+),score=119.67 gb/GEZJ01003295.1/:74-2584(+)